MIEKLSQDITGISFDRFVEFLFARSVPADEKADPWYWHVEVTFEPRVIAEHYIKLFTDPKFLLSAYSKPQLEQAFWAIHSGNLDCSVARIIWIEELSFAVREQCVRSMFHLYEQLFSIEPLDTSAHMWWDSLCYDWHCDNRARANGGEDQAMQDVMFQTLARILELDSPRCQGDALHGLGHLHHPETEQLVERYIASHPAIAPEQKKYALAAAQFKVL